jgi:hypothetical protein
MVHNGDGAWLMGTIASMSGCGVGNSRNCASAAERWFSLIHRGDTPETSSAAKITEDWLMEFLRSARGGRWRNENLSNPEDLIFDMTYSK